MCCTLDTFLLIYNSQILIFLMKSVEEVKKVELKKFFNLHADYVTCTLCPSVRFLRPSEERVIIFIGTGEFNLCSHFLFHSVN